MRHSYNLAPGSSFKQVKTSITLGNKCHEHLTSYLHSETFVAACLYITASTRGLSIVIINVSNLRDRTLWPPVVLNIKKKGVAD